MANAPDLPLPEVSRTRLSGRAAEAATARALLLEEAAPLLTLTGPGGVDKTRAAFAVAQTRVPDHAPYSTTRPNIIVSIVWFADRFCDAGRRRNPADQAFWARGSNQR